MQVLDCEQLPGGCVGNGNAESVFDTEKEQLVDSLFRLLQATAGTGLHGGFNGSLAEAPALTDFLARQADLDRHQLKANSIACLTSMPCNPRWRSNATDLAAMNQSSGSFHSAVVSDLGWRPPLLQIELASSPDSGGLSLSNSGRELRAVSTAAEDTPAGAHPGGPLTSRLLASKSSNAGLSLLCREQKHPSHRKEALCNGTSPGTVLNSCKC